MVVFRRRHGQPRRRTERCATTMPLSGGSRRLTLISVPATRTRRPDVRSTISCIRARIAQRKGRTIAHAGAQGAPREPADRPWCCSCSACSSRSPSDWTAPPPLGGRHAERADVPTRHRAFPEGGWTAPSGDPSGHAHAVFSLRKPVFRGERARPFPLAVLARCSEWLLAALQTDAGFTGVLVSNPTHQDVDAEVVLARVLEDGEALAAHVLLRGRDPQIGAGLHGLSMERGFSYFI